MDGYKVRVADEYNELKDRYNKLHNLIIKHDAGTLGFEINCPIEVLKKQKSIMKKYLYILEVRAEIEDIDLRYKDRCCEV